ncbi:MAG TPA: hypothetical protein VIV11_01765 [Kofleriaceae bacterium]
MLSLVLVALSAPSVAAQDTPTESKSEKRKRLKEERAQKKLEREMRAKERRHKRREAKRKAERAAARAAAKAAKAAAAEQAASDKVAAEQAASAQTAPTQTDAAQAAQGDPSAVPTDAPTAEPANEPQSAITSAATAHPTGEIAATTPPPAPKLPAVELAMTKSVTAEPRKPRSGPRWFFALRGGPSVVDRRGFNEYQSNRQIYADHRNIRAELALGRFVSRHFALGLAAGSGPYPKFDAPDLLLDEITRYEVYPAHARLDLELHAGWFVLAVGVGAAYERAQGTFTTQDPDTFEQAEHRSVFERFGAIGTARTGLQIQLGHLGIELLAEASAVKLGRGTYQLTSTNPGPSDREMAYVGSVLLGVRLQ